MQQSTTQERIEALAKLAVDLNRFDDSSLPDGMRGNALAARFVHHEIVRAIGEASYSKSWWVRELGKTEEEWSAWYYSPERFYEEWQYSACETEQSDYDGNDAHDQRGAREPERLCKTVLISAVTALAVNALLCILAAIIQ